MVPVNRHCGPNPGDVNGAASGPFIRCGKPARRYGPGGSPLCADCKPSGEGRGPRGELSEAERHAIIARHHAGESRREIRDAEHRSLGVIQKIIERHRPCAKCMAAGR